jgi:hypothetical protein
MLPILNDFARLLRASRAMGRASRLETRGQHEAAVKEYTKLIHLLDSLVALPPPGAASSIRDGLHLSIRTPATTSLAALHARAGEHERGRQLARDGLALCLRFDSGHGKFPEWIKQWSHWARSYLGRDSAAP